MPVAISTIVFLQPENSFWRDTQPSTAKIAYE